jgi:hypothetical protein
MNKLRIWDVLLVQGYIPRRRCKDLSPAALITTVIFNPFTIKKKMWDPKKCYLVIFTILDKDTDLKQFLFCFKMKYFNNNKSIT